MTSATAGMPVTLSLTFWDESTGLPADPASVQLDITYGEQVGFVADTAGPFTYAGASGPAPGVIWRTGVGLYSFTWQVPADSAQGVYVANWTCSYDGASFLGVENFTVSGGFPLAVPSADLGYWTGSIAYTPSPGSTTQLSPVTIPLGGVDGNGIAWLLNKVEGWDGPDVQGGGVIPKSGDHGAWASPQYYAARNLTLTITASAPGQALRDLARGLLQEAIPVSDLAVFSYDEPVPKQAQVRRSGKISETYPTLTDVQFTCGLVAPDPRKYAVQVQQATVNAPPSVATGFTFPLTFPLTMPAQAPAGAVSVTNAGTFETRPACTVSGPVTGPGLMNVTTGQQVSWTGLVLNAGDVLTADFLARQGYLNGTYRPADLFSAWWVLPPGTSTIQLTGDTGAGASLAVTWQDSWI